MGGLHLFTPLREAYIGRLHLSYTPQGGIYHCFTPSDTRFTVGLARTALPTTRFTVGLAQTAPITRFTVGLGKADPLLHPFHCWARKDRSLSLTRFTVGLGMPASFTRFTVGLEVRDAGSSHHTTWISTGIPSPCLPGPYIRPSSLPVNSRCSTTISSTSAA